MRNYILILALLTTFGANVYCQEPIDTEGRDFILTFLPNYHNNNMVNITDSLHIFVSSKVKTNGKITYYNRNGSEFVKTFSIDDPIKIYTFSTTFYNYELLGFNNSGNLIGNSQNEAIAKQSFRVEADDNITVYALNQASLTSEAFLVIPTDALGKEYYVMAYNSDGKRNAFSLGGGSTPSQFAVVASEDSTVVSIQSSSATLVNGTNSQQRMLNKGEVYLVQSLITTTNLYADLTGSLVLASKPVAVFAGHQRASLPVSLFETASRDHLVEQMVPIKSWGKNAIIVPFQKAKNEMLLGYDICRVMAANDNTQVKIKGNTLNINAGNFYEFELNEALFIEANQPILVAQYKKSSNNSSTSSSNVSDPLMLLIPPVEQYINSYRVINAQGKGVNSMDQLIAAYDEQYITVIIEKDYTDDLTLDGSKVNSAVFKQVEDSDYYYANLKVSDGVHNLSSVGRFAVFVYGYGIANSYGYLGGMGLVEYDLVPPNINSSIDCFKAVGAATDSNVTDSKIFSLKSTSSINTNVRIDNFVPYKSVVGYEAELVNKFLDGRYSLTAIDSSGLITEKIFDIPGFTIDTKDHFSTSAMTSKSYAHPTDSLLCFDVELYNYGSFPTTVSDIYFKNYPDLIKRSDVGSFVMAPGEKRNVTFCILADDDIVITDTLIIGNDCITRQVEQVTLEILSDKFAPLIVEYADTCSTNFIYSFIDDRRFDRGVDKCEIVKNINCLVYVERTNNLNIKVYIEVIDPTKDTEFKLLVVDRNGNEVTVEKFIPGYTIQFSAVSGNSLNFEQTQIGDFKCKTVSLTNYGTNDILLQNVRMFKNVTFSIPQSQLPFEIKANQSRELNVCYAPNSSIDSVLSDTLLIDYNCILSKIPVVGKVIPLKFSTDSKCDVELVFETKTVSNTISINPSPIISRGNIVIGISEETSAKILIYNMLGECVGRLFEADNVKGMLNISFDSTQFGAGTYIIQVITGNTLKNYPVVIAN